jgi:tripartite-type tricarboxylate transporter receptor subunit TctC
LFAPAKTPRPIVLALNRVASEIVNVPEIRKKLAADTSETVPPHAPEEFRAFFNEEIERWEKFVRSSGIKLD